MSTLPLALALALYLLSTGLFIGHVLSTQEWPRRGAITVLAGAFLLHLLALAWRATLFGYEAFAPFQEGLSIIACLMVGVYLLIAQRTHLTIVGAQVAPLAFLFALSAYTLEAGPSDFPQRLQSVWLPAHVIPTFIGSAIFAVAFCLSLTYALQERQIKAKRHHPFSRRLPSLETLDDLNHRFVAWGFALFSVGLITGSLLAYATWGALWSWEPIQVWSTITWLLYALLLQARTIGWRGRKAATLTLISFVILVVSFTVISLLAPGKHGGAIG